jgi:FKBP-type peptidyl-prolyl cis-trans isomerase (trigger factor)
MKTEIKKIDATKREIDVEVTGDIVKNKFEEVYAAVSKEAKVQGFRPGHAPRDMVEKQYSSLIHEQVLKELVPHVYDEVVSTQKLEVLELPEITNVSLDRQRLSFKATVEVSPEIQVKNYKGLKIEYRKVSVAADEVKRSIDSLKEARKIEVIDDNFAKSLAYPNLAELEKSVERQIFLRKEDQERQRIESEVVEAITKNLEFKLPQSLINRQLNDLVKQAKLDLALKGVPREQIDEHEKGLFTEYEAAAKKQVKIYLVLAQIAKNENIPFDNHMSTRAMEFLLKEAQWQEKAA